jgi:tetrahydromethanopterin S-methyltransferase subunit G
MSVSIETDLKEILGRFEQKLDKFEQKLDKVAADVVDLKVDMATVKTKLDGIDKRVDGLDKQIGEIKNSQRNQIWALIGILLTAILGILAAGSKILFFSTNP